MGRSEGRPLGCCFCDVLESAVDGPENMLVHHWGIIPDDKGSIAYPVSQVALYVNVAGTVTIDIERDLQGGGSVQCDLHGGLVQQCQRKQYKHAHLDQGHKR